MKGLLIQYSLITTLLSADIPSLGKFDSHSLSDQSLFELLMSGFEEQSEFVDENGFCRPILDIQCLKVDSTDRITSIDLYMHGLGGTLFMKYFPPHLKKIDFFTNNLSGKFETEHLPPTLRFGRFKNQNLTGGLDVTILPRNIRFLDVGKNKLSGGLNFDFLPESLEGLLLMNNSFEGTIDIRKVKQTLCFDSSHLSLSDLWNDTAIPHLSGKLILNVSNNAFVGDILVRDVGVIQSTMRLRNKMCTRIVDEHGGMLKI